MDKPLNEQEQALASAYAGLRRTLLGLLSRQVRDAQQAEDLLHEVFLKALKTLREGRAPGNLAAWLFRVMQTTLVDHYRRQAREPEALDEALLDSLPAQDGDSAAERLQALADCLEPLARQLPEPYRSALIAADLQGRPLATLTEGQSLSAVKSRVSRARAMLRERLQRCCALECDAQGRVLDTVDSASACACRTARVR